MPVYETSSTRPICSALTEIELKSAITSQISFCLSRVLLNLPLFHKKSKSFNNIRLSRGLNTKVDVLEDLFEIRQKMKKDDGKMFQIIN